MSDNRTPPLRRFSSFTRKLLAPFNENEEILIVRPEVFSQKLSAILAAGPQNLQIVTDFDFTLSRRQVDQTVGHSTYSILQHGVLNEEGRKKTRECYEYYHRIEVDPNVPPEEKAVLMHEWWETGNQMVLDQEVYQDMMPDLISQSTLYLRNGTDRMIWLCEKHSVPLTIISAGVGNVIETALKCISHYNKIEIFSNFMEWDEAGRLVKFSEPALKSGNKKIVLKDKPVKSHLILLGDMPSDTYMVDHCEYTECLKIGFINDITVYDIEDFKKHFDILVLHDGNMTVVELILSLALGEDFNVDLFPTLDAVLQWFPVNRS